jgi:transposase
MNVSRPVVGQYLTDFKATGLSYDEIKEMADSELLALFEKKKIEKDARYQELCSRFDYFFKELKRKGVTLKLLWEEYKEQNPEGYSYTQFCYHFQIFRSSQDVTMHIDHKAGDKMFVDYTGAKLSIYDPKTGVKEECEVFVAILGCSQLTYAEATPSQRSEEWIRSNERALSYFGGVPAAIVPDNLKSGVTHASRYEPGINPLFDDFAQHYKTVILPARVAKARDKALVEGAVRLVYQRIYAPLRDRVFFSLDELNEAIWELLEHHNNTPFQRLDISRRELFNQVEKSALKALHPQRFPHKHFKELTVASSYHIELREDLHYYSVPYRFKGKKVRVIYDERIVSIYHDNVRIAQHRRDRAANGYSTSHDHRPANHRSYLNQSPDHFLSWAESIGTDTKALIEKVLITKKHPEQAQKVCLGILTLAKSYNPDRLNKACKRALDFGLYSYKTVKNILERKLEQENIDEINSLPLPIHENIRGKDYYQ